MPVQTISETAAAAQVAILSLPDVPRQSLQAETRSPPQSGARHRLSLQIRINNNALCCTQLQ